MGPGTMNTINLNSNSDTTLLAIPKLCDDGSNWSDYYPRIQNAMGAKGLWRVIGDTCWALQLRPYHTLLARANPCCQMAKRRPRKIKLMLRSQELSISKRGNTYLNISSCQPLRRVSEPK